MTPDVELLIAERERIDAHLKALAFLELRLDAVFAILDQIERDACTVGNLRQARLARLARQAKALLKGKAL